MGASDDDSQAGNLEKPQHGVIFSKGFWIADTLITRRQFSSIMGVKTSLYESSDDSPASQHTWEEAIQFCKQLSPNLAAQLNKFEQFNPNRLYEFNLPTEAQWEYACRAGSLTKWFFGNDESLLSKYAWYDQPTAGMTLPAVKLKKPNPWGIYDLYGMVYEWCLDDLIPYSRIDPTADPSIPINILKTSIMTRVVRGGSINDAASFCRSSSRNSLVSWNSENDLTGIRLVLNEIS